MKTEPQEHIIMAISVISLMSNTLNTLNIQMGMCLCGDSAKEHQENREKCLESIAGDLAEVANKLGDYLNNFDAVDENMIAITTPLFEIINGGFFE